MTGTPKKVLVGGLLVGLALGLTACRATPAETTAPTGVDAAGCITDFDAATDYFPDKAVFEQATNVSVEYHNSYKVITVDQPYPDAPAESYVLVQCGAPAPELSGELASAVKVEIPAKAIVGSSTTQVPAFELLDEVSALAGMSSADLISDGPVKTAIDRGEIASIGSDGMEVNLEDVVAAAPDVFFASGYADSAVAKLQELGIPVVSDASWLETSALGRAEWIKFTALFLNAEAKAAEIYSGIHDDYQKVKQLAAGAESSPTVLLGTPYSGTWYAAGAESYPAAMVADAGGTYLFTDQAPGTGSTQMSLEEALAVGASAEFWLNGKMSGRWANMQEILQDDPRLGNLTAVTTGNVWTYSKVINAGGGNDYWQSGVMRPDLVLADMVAILHPELMPDHEFAYYEQVPQS